MVVRSVPEDPAVIQEQQNLNREQAEVTRLEKRHDELIDLKDRSDAGGALDVPIEEVANVQPQIEATRNALRIARRRVEQRIKSLTSAKALASRRIAEASRPDHVELVKSVANVLANLRAATIAERSFRDLLESRGVSYGVAIRPMPIANLSESDIDRWLAEAGDYVAGKL